MNFKERFIKTLLPLLSMLQFAIYPVLFLYAHNVNELVLHQLWLPLFAALILSVVLFLVCFILFRNIIKAAIATTLLLIVFWYYGLIFAGISGIVRVSHYQLIPVLLFISFYLLFFLSGLKQESTLNKLNTLLLVPVSMLVLYNTITILPAEFRKCRLSVNSNKTWDHKHKADTQKNPDIYLVILDEYASSGTMKAEWGYDNSAFTSSLGEKGFFIAQNSEVRNLQSIWNIATLLNLNYVAARVDKGTYLDWLYDPGNIKETKEYAMLKGIDFNEMVSKIDNNFFTGYLKDHGYKIVVLENII